MSIEKKDEKVEGFMSGFKKLLTETFGTKQNFKEAKLTDGTIVAYEGDMPMEGMEIYVIPSDGSEKLPAPDGVHTLEDGTQIEVVAGKITKVVAAAPMSTEKPSASVPETEAAAKRIVESTIKETVFTKDEVTKLVTDLKSDFSAQLESVKKESTTAIETLTSANEALTKEVATAKAEAEKVKTQFSAFATETAKLIQEFGGAPQKKEEKKQAEFNNEKPKPISMDEFRNKYIKQ